MTSADNATTPGAPDPGRIVLLTTSHRVAPGLLSWPAWQALRGADKVLCADERHPQLPYLREAGVHPVTGQLPTARELVDYCLAGEQDSPPSGGRGVVVIAGVDGEPRLTDGLSRLAGSGREQMPALELLPGSYDLPGARLLDLVQIMDQIRAQCPWSGTQTHEGLTKYGIEEAYELVEAIEDGDREALREELGDVLLQVVFHARIAQDDPDEPFAIDEVAATLIDKLIHRHPHIFGDGTAETAADVRANWLRAKVTEKQRTSAVDGVPLGQPALALAAKLVARARTAGLDVDLPTGPDAAAEAADAAGGIGYQLLALAARAQSVGTDPETALRAAARSYRDAIRAAEATVATAPKEA